MENKNESKDRACTPKFIFIIVLFCVLAVASLIVIILLVLKTDNHYNDYYISDYISELEEETGKKLVYRKVNTNIEHYICELNERVKRIHVRYKNRYGIELAGDLYTPKNLDKNQKHKAIVIGPPYGGVKEQGPSVYANELASRNYIVLTFDPSFNGESGGRPRKIASSDIFMEDFSAGVDYLGTLKYVDREKIGGIGICGSGGFLLGAATIDIRIKAIVTISLYDIPNLSNDVTEEEWNKTLMDLKEQRWKDVDNKCQEYDIIYESDREYKNDSFPSKPDPDEYDKWRIFYSTERGHHPRATGAFTKSSLFSIANLQVTSNITRIQPRPILFVAGEDAHSLSFSEKTLAKSGETDDFLLKVPNANHIDLYDDKSKIPFDDIDKFFSDHLD